MKISTKGRYALRVILDLAIYGDGSYVSLADISQRQGISLKYLESIISSLKSTGLVESARGKTGGYRLTKEPEEYTVGEILKSAEGSLAPVSCLDSAEACPKADSCLTLPIWSGLDKVIDDYLENYTIYKVINKRDKDE